MRGVLEAALGRHSTLTQGNWISVSFAGQEHELLVQKTRPGSAISVIGDCSCSCSTPFGSRQFYVRTLCSL